MKKILYLVLLFTITSCMPKLQKHFFTAADIEEIPASFEGSSNKGKDTPCRNQEAYIPDTAHLDHTPIKYIRLNIHWMNSSDSTENYVGEAGIKFAKDLMIATNYDLQRNHKMWLPNDNNTPKLPIRYRYVLTPRSDDPEDEGVYFHYDDELYYYVGRGKNSNVYDKRVFKKYGTQLDTVLNVFILPHHPDSIDSPTYAPYMMGVALGNAVKITGVYENKGDCWLNRGNFNHELGHILGLSHAWTSNDGCDDTPKHKQVCWGRGDRPECATITSNNVMDYNAMQHAWTPCQIGKVHRNLSNLKHRARKFLQPNWCELHEGREIIIRDTVVWAGAKDLEGHLTIEEGGDLTIQCRASLPKDAKITIKPGGILTLDNGHLHNACGDQWQGIEIQKQGKKKGRLIYVGEPKVEDVANAVE